jgi:hypothetical protein
LPALACFAFQTIEEVDDVEEPAWLTAADSGAGDGKSQMRLPVPVPPTSTNVTKSSARSF